MGRREYRMNISVLQLVVVMLVGFVLFGDIPKRLKVWKKMLREMKAWKG